MTANISVRELVRYLLQDKFLIVAYTEFPDGGFDLSVRIDEEELKRIKEDLNCK